MTTGSITMFATTPAGWIIDGWLAFLGHIELAERRASQGTHWHIANDNDRAKAIRPAGVVSQARAAFARAHGISRLRLARSNARRFAIFARGEGAAS